MATTSAVVSVSRWDKTSATTFPMAGRNSTRKSKSMSLLAHWC
jgi:hypothetical protein